MDLPEISNDHFQGGQEQREVGRQKVGQRTRIESRRPRGAYLRRNGQAEHARKRAAGSRLERNRLTALESVGGQTIASSDRSRR
jgi:hypothetical protein